MNSDVVRDEWLGFTEPIEGGIACWYNDIRGKTTIAYGNLCNTPGEAVLLPMVHPDGTPATEAEKLAAWHVVHNDPLGASKGWTRSATLTPLRLTRAGMGSLALARFDMNTPILRARVQNWDDIPACARMALHSLAWAAGANAHFPRLFEAVNRRDWDQAKLEIHLNEWTPEGLHNVGLVPRNIANKILMSNAERVDNYKLDPDLLDWKHELGVADAPTRPEIPNPASSPTICVEPIVHADPVLYRLYDDDEPDDAA